MLAAVLEEILEVPHVVGVAHGQVSIIEEGLLEVDKSAIGANHCLSILCFNWCHCWEALLQHRQLVIVIELWLVFNVFSMLVSELVDIDSLQVLLFEFFPRIIDGQDLRV